MICNILRINTEVFSTIFNTDYVKYLVPISHDEVHSSHLSVA